MSVQGDFITVPELQANGCLTGDCPHNSASDCIDHLTLMIGMLRDSAGEEDAGPRAYLPPVVVTRIQNFLDGHPADDSIIKLADAKGRPFTHVTAGWLRSILRTEQTPNVEPTARAIAEMGGHLPGIRHLLKSVLAADRTDAERYRALRTGATLGLTEDQALVLGVTVVAPDESDDIEQPMTERVAPFLTDAERSDLNGDRLDSKGYVRGSDAIDRAVDFVRKAIRTPDADGGL